MVRSVGPVGDFLETLIGLLFIFVGSIMLSRNRLKSLFKMHDEVFLVDDSHFRTSHL